MDLLTYEWRRARSIRTTWITSLFVILSVVGFSYLISIAGTDADGNPVKVPAAEVVSQSVLGNPIVMVLVASLGAMAFGHEYRYGTIRLTLTAFPRRTGVFFAKLLTTLFIPLLVLAVAVAASYGLLVALGSTDTAALGDPAITWPDALWQMPVFVLTYAVLAFCLTLITRNHPLGIIGPLLLSLVETALIAILGGRVEWLPQVLPLWSMQTWFSGEDVALSVGVWGAWMVALLVLGFVLLRRRDA
ncbi:MAG: ABC transporter permease [Micrococcales bacterium]|nr:ABC transporter permease [Micrococcales bacterium]